MVKLEPVFGYNKKRETWMSGFSSGNKVEHIQENLVALVEELRTEMEAAAGLITFIHHGLKKPKQIVEVYTQWMGEEPGSLLCL